MTEFSLDQWWMNSLFSLLVQYCAAIFTLARAQRILAFKALSDRSLHSGEDNSRIVMKPYTFIFKAGE